MEKNKLSDLNQLELEETGDGRVSTFLNFDPNETLRIGKLHFAAMLVEISARTGNWYNDIQDDLEENCLDIGLDEYLDKFDSVIAEFQEKTLRIALEAQRDLLN